MIITLLSDFGQHDFTPAVVKGILFSAMPEVKIVDISHDLTPFHLLQCAYFLKSSFRFFPKDTVHLSLINIFGGKPKPGRTLMAHIDGQYIITADNGLLGLTFNRKLDDVFVIDVHADNFLDWINRVVDFIKTWSGQGNDLSRLEKTVPQNCAFRFEPYTTEDTITCQIIHVDRNGNVVLNLSRAYFEEQRKGRNFSISFSRYSKINKISNNYSDVPEGEKLCLFNLGGFMEIAVNQGSAADLFGLSLTKLQQLVYSQVKIEFE